MTIIIILAIAAIAAFVAGAWLVRRRAVRHRLDTERAKQEIYEYCRRAVTDAEAGKSVARPT
jgi:hypothetical protein